MIQTLYNCSCDAGFNLTDSQLSQFSLYNDLLLTWNEKMNLTAITDPSDVAKKHFVDSLFGHKYVSGLKSVIDVGTGAGFPGIPLKILNPHLSLTLLDSLNKRLNFLNEVVSSLKLTDVETIHSRAEDGGMVKSPLREKYDAAVSRAMAQLNVLAEYCLPYVKVGGVFLAYKGPDIKTELSEAEGAVKTLGGEVSEVFSYNIPTTDINHTIVVIKKVKPTPTQYPRPQGKISKKPL